MVISDIEVAFEYGDDAETVNREIARNVRTLLSTPIGTCPLYREFGLNVAYLDYPIPAAQSLFTVAVMEAVERWEPRVRVTDVSFTADSLNGAMKAKVVIASGQLAQITF